MPRFHSRKVNPREWVIAGATVFFYGLVAGMNLLTKSEIKQTNKVIEDIHTNVALLRVDIKDIKPDLAVVKSDFSNIKADLIDIRTNLTNEMNINRRMVGRSPFSFLPDPNRPARPGADGEKVVYEHLAADDEADEFWDGRGPYQRRAIPLLHLLAILMTVEKDFKAAHNFVAGIAQSQQATLGPPPAVEKGLTPEKEMERREVYRNYHNQPPAKMAQSLLCPIMNLSVGVGAKAGTREQLKKELGAIRGVYEEYLLRGLAFPGAAEYHNVIGELVDRVLENWLVSGDSGEDASAVVVNPSD
ncbi:hypothetical protein B9Z19DRAFT_1189674 [Tuber borchii]|uniref:Uncharacterized protein n=1 Tax=Tuber borchii TaxID=42251 RepID=A0A2T7A6V2_TUBBO|nr:hypothetical protein B9Z19DRAFT_1189674 [Tuber borchii]